MGNCNTCRATIPGIFGSSIEVNHFFTMYSKTKISLQGMTNEQVLYFVKEGGTLPKPEFADTIMYDLMCACWQQQPFSRPTFMQIVASLEMLTGNLGTAFEEVSFYHSEMGQRERHEIQPESAEDDALLSSPLYSLQNSNNLSLLTHTQHVYANIDGNYALRHHSQHILDS